MMRMPLSVRLALGFTFAAVVASSGEASAGCQRACGEQVKECAADARPTLLECRDECRSTATKGETRECMRGCRTILTSTRGTCHNGRASCIDACRSGVDATSVLGDGSKIASGGASADATAPGDVAAGDSTKQGSGVASDDPAAGPKPPEDKTNSASCMGQCGQTLGACAHGVAAGGTECIKGCKSAEDRSICIRACTSAARDVAASCKAEAEACRTACGFPTSSTTTLAEPPPTTVQTPTTTIAAPTTTIASPTTTAEPSPTTTALSPTTTESDTTPTTTLVEPVPCESATAPTCAGTCIGSSTAVCAPFNGGCGCVD